MRKAQQKQILAVLASLREAQTAGLYADCQEGAIGIGEFIEQIKGEGTETVTLLEEYCELLYKASIGEAGQKALNKALIRVENSVKNELKPTKIEAVFLSYKASMSDSIESIYTAAKSDPACDAYWIPIPYYELKPDGTYDVMRYEGQDYYKPHIECTDYRAYNIEERRPDMIFTFAPYDDVGMMTSVHQDYYCERLRELTDMLVYVPYFVTDDRIKGPFVQCAGVVFSHLVIVQSEGVRQAYIHEYKELAKEGYTPDIYGKAEDKIIALGSPKFDAVINAKRDDFTLPENWQNLLEGKKAIFFNTSIGAILNNGEQYLKKIRYVHETFRNRDDVVLWWRPHPLSESAYKSMEPGLMDLYKKIVNEYRHDAFGIYDDTPDLHRAIAYTDVYYGDWSSVIFMFQVDGKPVFVQDPNMCGEDTPELMPYDFYETDDYYWFYTGQLNSLFRIDKETLSKPEYVCSFPSEELGSLRPFTAIEKSGNKLYFAPCMSEAIGVYDLNTGVFINISIPVPSGTYYKQYNKDRKFSFIFNINSLLYFIPITYPGIVAYDPTENKITIIDDWIKPLNDITHTINRAYFSRGFHDRDKNCLILPCPGADAVLEVNLHTHQSSVRKLESNDQGYLAIIKTDNYYWLINRAGDTLFRLEPETEKTLRYVMPSGIVSADIDVQFQDIYFYESNILLIPCKAKFPIKFDLDNDSFSVVEDLKTDSNSYVYSYSGRGSHILLGTENKQLVEYDPVTGANRITTIKLPDIAGINKLYAYAISKGLDKAERVENCTIFESPYNITSEYMLDTIVLSDQPEWMINLLSKQNKLLSETIVNPDGSTGLMIWQHCKEKVLNSRL